MKISSDFPSSQPQTSLKIYVEGNDMEVVVETLSLSERSRSINAILLKNRMRALGNQENDSVEHKASNVVTDLHGRLLLRQYFEKIDRLFGASKQWIDPETSASCLGGPPPVAKLLLLLVPLKNREGMMGDLEEEYRTILVPEYGARVAKVYYWWHVLVTILTSISGAFVALSKVISIK